MRTFAFTLVTFAFAIVIPLNCVGCRLEPDTTATPPRAAPFDVPYIVLGRDLETARAYVGHRIRVRLEPREFRVDQADGRWHVLVWAGDRAAPPVLIFRCDEEPPRQSITITGICREPEKDGVWRSPRCNYHVVVDECVITVRPSP